MWRQRFRKNKSWSKGGSWKRNRGISDPGNSRANLWDELLRHADFILEFPDRKLSCSNWELISRFRCLLTSWIPRFDFFKVIWEVQCCKCFKIHAQHSWWFLKRHKNGLSGNCFSLGCKYLVKRFPACRFILKNGNSWRKAQLISSKKSKSRSFFSWSGNSWFPYLIS